MCAGELAAFIAILAWVNLSGAGGYGYQTYDYTIHNGRLLDLTNYSWPVHYSPGKNFVYYVGYFLPSALLGKITSYAIGMRSMYVWTVIGVSLALRWLGALSNWKFSIILVLVFALFGPLDILGDMYLYATVKEVTLRDLWINLTDNTDTLDFWTAFHAGFFIGNFLSNTFQLYWSPQQIIAGWICAGILFHLFEKEKTRHFLFVYALLSLWAPLVMIAMSPIVLGVIILTISKDWRDIITTENIIGGGSIVLLMLAFYSAGSVNNNPSYWILTAGNHDEILLLFMLSWGIYGASLIPLRKTLDDRQKTWLTLLAIAAIALPLRTYGEYNDLLCRGSAPLMFLTLVFCLKNVKNQWQNNNRVIVAISLLVFATGSMSAIFQTKVALENYGVNQPTASVISYPNAYPNLGGDDNIFQKYLARKNR